MGNKIKRVFYGVIKSIWIILGILIFLIFLFWLTKGTMFLFSLGSSILFTYVGVTVLFLLRKKSLKIIINSGYFDPLHVGHIECMELSKEIGDKLVIILNNDKQIELKKGKSFMIEEERKKIIESLKPVDDVIISIDEDKSVCESIKAIAKKYKGHEIIFGKGGDRFSDEIPEAKICEDLGIKVVDNIGKKIQSSSFLIKKSNRFWHKELK